MAMAAYAMTVGDFVRWARRHGCEVVLAPAIAWRLGEIKRFNPSPRYLVKGNRRVAIPSSDDEPLDTFDVWTYKYRLGIDEDPT